jgi:glycosyltransferase involved in cell wall biosynthesis
MPRKKEEKKNKASICLVMIVKNESEVIKKCIDSVKDHISYWVICDTGSTDGTQDIIRKTMEEYGIPGELHEHEWVDYGTNRTKSLELSENKGDYRLVIDADDVLNVWDEDNLFVDLVEDSYKIRLKLGEISYFRTQIIRSNQKWKYVGVLHEYLEGPAGVELTEGYIEEAEMIAAVSGDTRDIKGNSKYYNDALIFERELVTKPDLEPGLKARYQFYLAQSYRDAGMYERSIENYQKRIDLGGWPEEIYISLYMIAKMKLSLGKSEDEVINSYLKAWEYRPVRLEAAYNLIRFLVDKKRYFFAFTIAGTCMRMRGCDDILFVESEIWKWKMADEFSVLAYYTGNINEAYIACNSVVKSEDFDSIPQSEKDRILKNFETFEKVYNEQKEKKKSKEAESVEA